MAIPILDPISRFLSWLLGVSRFLFGWGSWPRCDLCGEIL